MALEIEEQEKRAQQNEIEIDKARDAYAPFCRRTTKLFDIFQSIRSLSPIYCFNLQFFLNQFRQSIQITNRQLFNSITTKENSESSLSLEVKLSHFYSNLLRQLHR